MFFIFYELLLFPSIAVVLFVSSSRKAIQACLYFLIWTQIGSFLVLCCIAYICLTSLETNFFILQTYNFSTLEAEVLYFFLFVGFGFKVPIWPFHYWLTKTHVEAPSGFSIYLSGFLVKSALYGFYKLTNILGITIDTTFYVVISLLGVIDASLKMWGQSDLKKLVAYGTIQEMNLIYLMFCLGDSFAIFIGFIFSATHAFLSALMFFLVDCIYRRYHSRSVVEITGILQLHPNLGINIFIMSIFFSGLPGTLKFSCELYLFSGIVTLSLLGGYLLFFIANVFGLIGFSKNWFNALFGSNTKYFSILTLDLTQKEIAIIFYCFFFLFFFSWIPSGIF